MNTNEQVELKKIQTKGKIVANYNSAKVYLVDGSYHVLAGESVIKRLGKTHSISEAAAIASDFDKSND